MKTFLINLTIAILFGAFVLLCAAIWGGDINIQQLMGR